MRALVAVNARGFRTIQLGRLLVVISIESGQFNIEATALTRRAVDADIPAKQRHQLAANRQAQPIAAMHTITIAIHLMQSIKNRGLLGRLNATPLIRHLKTDTHIGVLRRAHDHLDRFVLAKFHRI